MTCHCSQTECQVHKPADWPFGLLAVGFVHTAAVEHDGGVTIGPGAVTRGATAAIMRAMLTVHHLENSRSHRVLWLLEELGLDYHIELYKRDPKTSLAPASLIEIHPLGKSPVVTEGDLTLAETGAIITYFVDRHDDGRLRPPAGSEERIRYEYWLHYAEGSLAPFLLLAFIANRIKTTPAPFFVKPVVRTVGSKLGKGYVKPQLTRHFGYIEDELSSRPWFAGAEFTAADIQMSFSLVSAHESGLVGEYPAIGRWVEAIRARDAYQKAVERGGPVGFRR